MIYYSTNKQAEKVNFREATIKGLAPDKGLYFPEQIPQLPKMFFDKLKSMSKAEIAFNVIRPYVGDCIAGEDLFTICKETIDFDFPLKQVSENIFSLELYHGPTLAFKDVGARFMSRCLGYFSKDNKQKIVVLVATSGDTGSAVANGFLGVDGVEVVILYPSGKVSKIQELQLTTLGQNIKTLEVQGTFDDCQAMVKQTFMDNELNEKLFLTSANSINIARWLPQQFYYFYALQQWSFAEAPVVCVPSGNFGNICAGLMAHISGLQVEHFIAACNSNHVFTNYLESGLFTPATVTPTISNAMDVGNPSNFVRILEQFQHSHSNITKLISSLSVDDKTTMQTISGVFQKYNYLLDPHGAVAYHALEQYLFVHQNKKGIMLETAHPVKFDEIVNKATGLSIEIPASVKHLLKLKKVSTLIKPAFNELKDFLLSF